MAALAENSNDELLYNESNIWYMITFLSIVLVITVILVMTVLTSNFAFYLLLGLISMATAYLHTVPTMVALLLSLIFLTPKVIMSVAIIHLSYIITNISRSYDKFGTALLQACIKSLTHH